MLRATAFALSLKAAITIIFLASNFFLPVNFFFSSSVALAAALPLASIGRQIYCEPSTVLLTFPTFSSSLRKSITVVTGKPAR